MLYTFINILDGTESFKQSVPKGEILTDVFLDTNTLKKVNRLYTHKFSNSI